MFCIFLILSAFLVSDGFIGRPSYIKSQPPDISVIFEGGKEKTWKANVLGPKIIQVSIKIKIYTATAWENNLLCLYLTDT